MATERFIRWFQYGALTPMVRAKGLGPGPAAMPFPAATEPVLIDYVRLRHHLSAYLQSIARKAHDGKSPSMQPLTEAFPDKAGSVHHVADQFMLGPALMVNPVPAGATSRALYLPAGSTWFDFWTGVAYAGGQHLQVPTPLRIMPIFVKAGSIIPYLTGLSPACGYAGAVELRVYPGSNGRFDLHDDRSPRSSPCPQPSDAPVSIPLAWNDNSRVLKIGAREGGASDPARKRVFRVVFVRPLHGAGLAPTALPDQIVVHTGTARRVRPLAAPVPCVAEENPANPSSPGPDALARVAIQPDRSRFRAGLNGFREDAEAPRATDFPVLVHQHSSP